MGRSTIPPALVELSSPSTPEAQVNALRNLKNEIVGHEQRKELTVVHGVIKPLARILRGEAKKGGKRRRGGAANGSGGAVGSTQDSEWGVEDELRFQATLVVGSLANGGPAFITPLLAGDVLPPLLESLSPAETPAKLVVTTLRTLNQIVDAVAQEKSWWDSSPTLSQAVTQQIYTKTVIESLAEILDQTSRSRTVYQQITSTTQLIIKTCTEENQRKLLLEAGVLELLAAKMTAIASADDPSRRQDMTQEALPTMYLPDILESISAIIRDSHYNTARFLYSLPVQNIFGWPKTGMSSTYDGYSNSSHSNWDKLIPRLQTSQSKSDPYTKTWPPLGPLTSGENYARLPSMESIQQTSSRHVVTDESETPLFTWLMFVARRGEGRERLAACWLLSLLRKFGERWQFNDPSKSTREKHFSFLIIPLVVKMIEEASPTSDYAKKMNAASSVERDGIRLVLERSPLILAELCVGNMALQTAASEARILPVLNQILKKSFDPVTDSSKPLWQPKNAGPAVRDPNVDPASSTLGYAGLSADVLHAFRYRESTLLALAALTDSDDRLRKVVVEMGTTTHIVDSLIPYQAKTGDTASQKGSTLAKDGNPDAVIIAACMLTRSLSRSVGILRTTLIDHGVSQPILSLLTHPNVKVQIAATEVITNLVLDFSPMRNDIIEGGALRILCEHCRSANFDLRFGSLWALKHLCIRLPLNTRTQCLEELGIGWLMQVLNGEPARPSTSVPLGMGTSNAAGERVDILNAADDPHMDVDEEPSSSEDEDTMTDSIPTLRRHQHPGSRYTSATNIRDRLQQIRNDEQDARLNGERDDIRIQEQALDFLRNFVMGDNNLTDTADSIDHLLKSFGHSAFFEIIDSKVRPKNSLPTSSSASPSSTTSNPSTSLGGGPTYWPQSRLSFPQATHTPHSTQTPFPTSSYLPHEILSATIYILVHLASGRPHHRSQVLSQTALMSHIVPLFQHPHGSVRLSIAWLVNNLVFVDDQADEAPTRERANILRSMGFEEGARLLTRDSVLDVRERAKTSLEQIVKLCGGGGPSGLGMGLGGGGYSPGGFGDSGLGEARGGGAGLIEEVNGGLEVVGRCGWRDGRDGRDDSLILKGIYEALV
ncbi:armadillo repeat domain-containing protein [Massarina eburnea CBS 473.64]|uniref:Armadillo repeat domain-containing protein n=1 Tax=Massarina eburnea CBS 473.64 TaxID=1395130 RepID=A0A6A6S1F5_9PLEO|nr:armadillo repeat domain-containing protein [Massarina eburnea CBS 473.64]